MPFSIVITREGISDAVTAVPCNWVVNDVLYWPKTRKKTEQENLRSNGESKPEANWKKQKCRVKVTNIDTFEEALKQEEFFSNFDDTEDEQLYLHRQQCKKPKYHDPIDLNTEFEKVETEKKRDKEVTAVDEPQNVVLSAIEKKQNKEYTINRQQSTINRQQSTINRQQKIDISTINRQQNIEISKPQNFVLSAIEKQQNKEISTINRQQNIEISEPQSFVLSAIEKLQNKEISTINSNYQKNIDMPALNMHMQQNIDISAIDRQQNVEISTINTQQNLIRGFKISFVSRKIQCPVNLNV